MYRDDMVEIYESNRVKVEELEGKLYKECVICRKTKLLFSCFELVKTRKARKGGKELRFYRDVCILCFKPDGLFDYEDWANTKPSLKNHKVAQWQWETLFNQQGRKCAICGRGEPSGNKRKYWNIDHDHKCCPGSQSCGKCIRGILCSNCNIGLGRFNDDTKTLEAAIQYLRRDRPKFRVPRPKAVREKIAAGWDDARRKKQSELMRSINERKDRADYKCPDCGEVLTQVTKQEVGGHRKMCSHWTEMTAWFEKEDKVALDEALSDILGETNQLGASRVEHTTDDTSVFDLLGEE